MNEQEYHNQQMQEDGDYFCNYMMENFYISPVDNTGVRLKDITKSLEQECRKYNHNLAYLLNYMGGMKMEFDRFFELTGLGARSVSDITAWIDTNLGLEYEIDLDDGACEADDCEYCGVVTIFGITLEEDRRLNEWLDQHSYQVDRSK